MTLRVTWRLDAQRFVHDLDRGELREHESLAVQCPRPELLGALPSTYLQVIIETVNPELELVEHVGEIAHPLEGWYAEPKISGVGPIAHVGNVTRQGYEAERAWWDPEA